MEKEYIDQLLRNFGLRKTNLRIEILRLFLDHDFALSAKDIFAKLTIPHDKVTIYRALSSFEEQGILHRASVQGQSIKYAIYDTHRKHSSKKHAHFVCDECQNTFCLNDVEVPDIQLPEGALVNRVNLTIGGVCEECVK